MKFLLLSIWLLISSLPAQEVELQFLAFPETVEKRELHLKISDKQTIPVALPSHELSKVYQVPRMAFLGLGMPEAEEFKEFGRITPLKYRPTTGDLCYFGWPGGKRNPLFCH